VRKKKALLRESLGYFENYVEYCGRSNRPLDILLVVLGLIVFVSLGASVCIWPAG
jgi:hypothetical protein